MPTQEDLLEANGAGQGHFGMVARSKVAGKMLATVFVGTAALLGVTPQLGAS
jgi:hypothetical protein